MVTMGDVARASGVSSMTVSNVVNGREGVSVDVRRRVLAEIQRSGYRMNVSARNLRRGRSGVIGLAVPELDRSYFGQLGARITAVAAEHGYRVAVEETGASTAGELAAIQQSRALAYDGLILTAVDANDQFSRRDSFPVVLLGERSTPAGLDHITLPNYEGALAAGGCLVERGCRHIVFVGGPTDRFDALGGRLDGFQASLRAAGLEPGRVFPAPNPPMSSGREAAHRILEIAPETDGIVAVTDSVAIGVLRGLADRGTRVPQDIKVIGFDDVPEADYLTPSLSTVAPDHDSIARRAFELLIARIDGSTSPGITEVASFSIIERESTSG